VGTTGLGGVPSGTASDRDGGNGGTGGRGGHGGTGGTGGIGRWDIWASFTYANSSTIYVGGVYGNTGDAGGQSSSGSSGGGGGFANWPGFTPGEDGGGTTYIRSNGYFDIYGIYRVYWEGSIINYHRLWVSGGTLINYETITNHADFKNTGTVINYGTIDGDLNSSGTYWGMGVLNGTLTNTGVIAPGYQDTPGITTIENLSTPDGTIQITLTGHDVEAYDQLEVTGSLLLAGATLQPEFQAGFDESLMTLGDSFDVIKYRTIISDELGGIDDTLAQLTNGEWTLEYNHDLGEGWYGIRLVYGTGLSAVEGDIQPVAYSLDGIHPNPFNPMTTVHYALPQAGTVTFRIYDLAGRLVWSRQEDAMPAGRHDFVWRGTDSNGQSLASGSYVLRMRAKGFVDSRKVMLVR